MSENIRLRRKDILRNYLSKQKSKNTKSLCKWIFVLMQRKYKNKNKTCDADDSHIKDVVTSNLENMKHRVCSGDSGCHRKFYFLQHLPVIVSRSPSFHPRVLFTFIFWIIFLLYVLYAEVNYNIHWRTGALKTSLRKGGKHAKILYVHTSVHLVHFHESIFHLRSDKG